MAACHAHLVTTKSHITATALNSRQILVLKRWFITQHVVYGRRCKAENPDLSLLPLLPLTHPQDLNPNLYYVDLDPLEQSTAKP